MSEPEIERPLFDPMFGAMFDPNRTPAGFLDAVVRVVEAITAVAPNLGWGAIMLVGAFCRDAMHAAMGHDFPTRATYDVDLALGLRTWASYEEIAAQFQQVGDSGICYRIAGIDVDLLPFGEVEDPTGLVEPPSRGESLSVWAFEEIHAASLRLDLDQGRHIAIPTVPGYAAAKLGAWLDRSAWGEYKDATDIALILYWYTESKVVHDRLYESPAGMGALEAEEFAVSRAAAHLLGQDIVALIGPARQAELLTRWPGDLSTLTRELRIRGTHLGRGWPGPEAATAFIGALSQGLA